MATTSFADYLYHMYNKTWLLEMEVAACFVAEAIVAIALMLGNNLWKCLADK
jgi:hypothetical protein